MLGLGLRRRIKGRLKSWFGARSAEVATETSMPASVESPPVQVPPVEAPPAPNPAAAPPPETPFSPTTSDISEEITVAAVESLFDEMVRPGLQMDGGDITLVKIENNDIYVRLVGSCSSCPSSIMTLRMGVERLLQEEFPMMGALIPIDDELAVA